MSRSARDRAKIVWRIFFLEFNLGNPMLLFWNVSFAIFFGKFKLKVGLFLLVCLCQIYRHTNNKKWNNLPENLQV